MGFAGMGFILHSSLCGAIIQCVAETMWIIHQNFGYCWRELAQHQGFFSFRFYTSCPSSKLTGGGYRVWRGPSQERWPHMTNIPYHMVFCNKSSGKGPGKREHSWLWYLSPQITATHDEALLFKKGWTSALWLDALSKFLILLYLHMQHLLSLFNSLSSYTTLVLYLLFASWPTAERNEKSGYWPESIHHILSLNMYWEGSLDQEGMHTEANMDLAHWLQHLPCRGNRKWNQTKLNCITPESKKENTGLPAHSLKY